MQRRSESIQQAQEDAPESDQMEQDATLYPHQTLGFQLDERPVNLLREAPALLAPRRDIPPPEKHAAASAEATGPPPPCAAMQLAA